MRRGALRTLIPVFLFLYPLGSDASPSKVTSVEKVVDGVWMAQTEQGSNAGWFVLGDEVVAVDSGNDAATGKELLEKIQETAGKPVRHLVITHAHGDHGGGAAAFAAAGAEVICHENAAAALAPLIAASSKARSGLLAFSERLAFFGGQRRAAIYFLGPAHTAGDIILLLPEEKVLFSGDIVLSGRAPYMQSPDMNPQGWENILGRVGLLDVDKVVPGHGALGTRQAIAETLGYVKKINQLAQAMITEKVSEDLIEAALRRPGLEVASDAITPDFIANVRAVMRAEKAKPAPTPSPKPSKTPAKKKS